MSSVPNIATLATVSAGSILLGGAVGYYISRKCIPTKVDGDEETTNKIHKSTSNFASAVDKYIIDNSLREPEVLTELRKHTVENVARSIMLTDPVEGQLFRMLLTMLNAKKCIEVGSYTGYNTLNVALAIPSDGVVYSLDITDEYIKHGKPYFEKTKVSDRIQICIGPASETMDKLIDEQQGTFDFIFVDADKPGYDAYYEKGLILLRSGGILVLDNTLQSGRVLDIESVSDPRYKEAAEAINCLNMKIKNDNRVQVSFLKIADGVTLCLKL